MLHRVDFHQSPGIFVLIGNSLGTDHLHAEKPSALLLAKPAKSQVGNARHWCQMCIRDRPVRVLAKEPYEGVARGITDGGELLVEKTDGTIVAVSAGEVSVRGLYSYV